MTMKTFYAPETELHDPVFRITHGKILRNAELAERAHLLLGALDRLGLKHQPPAQYPRETLLSVHSERFVEFVSTCWDDWQKLPNAGPEVVPNLHPMGRLSSYPPGVVGRAGWHISDTSCPIGEHSWQAARRAADCALAAADAVLAGDAEAYALCRPPGHHSDRETLAGHCMFNNAALAAEQLRSQHDKVAILDIDVHHGNGTQMIFYDRADVLFVSVHCSPVTYYPFYLGYDHETGEGAGQGFNLNLPVERDSGDGPWHAAIAQAIAAVQDYAPGALVLSLGLDAYEKDPLQGLRVTTEGFGEAARMIRALDLPTVIVQEGGYLAPELTDNLAAFLGGWLAKTG